MRSWGVGFVLSLDNELSFTAQDDTRIAARLAREVLKNEDGCVAVNATGFPDWYSTSRKYPEARQSDVLAGRASCVPFHEDLSVRLADWENHGDTLGWVGYTWGGVSLALRALRQDPRVRKAIILFGKGVDRDHESPPHSLKQAAAEGLTTTFSLYFRPDDPLEHFHYCYSPYPQWRKQLAES